MTAKTRADEQTFASIRTLEMLCTKARYSAGEFTEQQRAIGRKLGDAFWKLNGALFEAGLTVEQRTAATSPLATNVSDAILAAALYRNYELGYELHRRGLPLGWYWVSNPDDPAAKAVLFGPMDSEASSIFRIQRDGEWVEATAGNPVPDVVREVFRRRCAEIDAA